jgi:hypothetical protein
MTAASGFEFGPLLAKPPSEFAVLHTLPFIEQVGTVCNTNVVFSSGKRNKFVVSIWLECEVEQQSGLDHFPLGSGETEQLSHLISKPWATCRAPFNLAELVDTRDTRNTAGKANCKSIGIRFDPKVARRAQLRKHRYAFDTPAFFS